MPGRRAAGCWAARGGAETLILAVLMVTACAHQASPPAVTAPPQEVVAPASLAAPAVSVAPASAAPRPAVIQSDAPPLPPAATPLPLPQSDPIPPPASRCPDVAALVKVSAVVRREPPSRTRPRPSPEVLDIELTLTLPANPMQVTLTPGDPSVYGGLLAGRALHPDRTKAVVLIRPAGTVAREGSLLAFFGVACATARGSLRVEMTFALPPHDGDRVVVRRVDGS